MHMFMESREKHSGCSSAAPHLTLSDRLSLNTELTDWARLAGLSPRGLLVSLSLLLQCWADVPMPSFHMVAGDLNSGPMCLCSEHFAQFPAFDFCTFVFVCFFGTVYTML